MFKIDNVYSSVWFGTALLSYEKYLSLTETKYYVVNLKDFYFSQVDILKVAKQISTNEVQNARISQWCNGSHRNSTYNYLVSRKQDSKRRLSIKGEFGFFKESPRENYDHLNFFLIINQRSLNISYQELIAWVDEIYYKFPLISDDSDIYVRDKFQRITNNKKENFFISKTNDDINEKFNLTEELTGTDQIYDSILNFLVEIQENRVEIYNEFSLQHELGIFLRHRLTSDLKIQFERNVYYFFNTKDGFTKREIDLCLFNEEFSKLFCIELKFPRNGQYPEQMFSICKDIKFLEELKNRGFSNCYSLTIVEDSNFYNSSKNDEEKIYRYFRNGFLLSGEIIKPTGEKKESLLIEGTYTLKWKNLNDYKFLLIKI